MKPHNYVAEAIDILGGVTKTSNLLGMSNAAVYHLKVVGRVATASVALKLEVLTRKAGREISAWDLCQTDRAEVERLTVVPFEPNRTRRRKKNAPAQNRTGTRVPTRTRLVGQKRA